MIAAGGAKVWFTALELAEMQLPGLPRTKRKVNEVAAAKGWAGAVDRSGQALARRRVGRGGGLEYHHSLLPASANVTLIQRGVIAPAVSEPSPCAHAPILVDQHWAWFEAQTEAVRSEARQRLGAVDAIDALERSGMTATAAVAAVAHQHGVSQATLWNWKRMCAGAAGDARLPRLAPQRKGGGARSEIHEDAWKLFKSDYLRLEGPPTLAACYGRTRRAAAEHGWGTLPHIKTFARRIEELDPRVVMLARYGTDALRTMLPSQTRSVAELHAMQHVNIDGHKWDVFVEWADGRISRPLMVGIQDLYSRKILAWRICETESAQDVRLVFADLFRDHGIPAACTLDNGRGFASKWITGGAPNRFRFKVSPGDPVGLLTSLKVQIHWTLPYRGQSKPIERAWKSFCGRIATHPAFAGAYTGNKPDAKPENYASKAVPIEKFRAVVSAEIAAHNAEEGRRTEMARGVLSYDQVFEASYAQSIIPKAGPEQLRLALLAADKATCDRKTGAVKIAGMGNIYWARELIHAAGQQVVVRFDPDDLHSDVHVYDLAGRFIATAPIWNATGFSDAGAAKHRARLEANHKKATKAALKAEQLLTADQVAAQLPLPSNTPEPLTPAAIRPVRAGGVVVGALALKPDEEPSRGGDPVSFMDRFEAAERRLRAVK